MSMTQKGNPKKFDQGRMVRELARERVGIVPSSKVFKEKRKKENDDIPDDIWEDYHEILEDYCEDS